MEVSIVDIFLLIEINLNEDKEHLEFCVLNLFSNVLVCR